MGKLKAFVGLHGKQDNLLVQKEKLKYLLLRIFGKSSFMGNGLNKAVVVKTPHGLFCCRKNKNDLHIISPHYEFEGMEIFKDLLKHSQVVFDVGSHIGKYSIMSAKLNPGAEVYAFEASKDNFEILSKNKKVNQLKNLYVMNKALSDKVGKEKFYVSQTGLMTKESDQFRFVETETIDNFLQKNKIEQIDLIKIDVDGNELKILKGAKKSLAKGKIKNIIIEIDGKNESHIRSLFSKLGYSVKQILNNNYLVTK